MMRLLSSVRGSVASIAGAVIASLLWATPGQAATGPLSKSDARVYRQAFTALEKGRLGKARRIARGAKDPLLRKVLLWRYLLEPGSGAGIGEIIRFVDDNPDWPKLDKLRAQAEALRLPRMSAAEKVAFFRKYAPRTTADREAFARALARSGKEAEAKTVLRRAWVVARFAGRAGRAEERRFLKRHRSVLRPKDHFARVERLLWKRQARSARRLLPLLDRGHRLLARAWLVSIKRRVHAKRVATAFNKVPQSLRRDRAYLYARLRWFRRQDKDAEAAAILNDPPAELGDAKRWWEERIIVARRALAMGKYRLAYTLAARHGLTKGQYFAEATFFSGWLALRYLKNPALALKHFETLYAKVKYPVSIARAAYWAGRAAAALKHPEWARAWYTIAAKHPATFYGQIAATRLGPDFRPRMPVPIGAAERTAFERKELVRAVLMMEQIGARETMRQFHLHLFHLAKTPSERALAAALALEQDDRKIAVYTAKQAMQKGDPFVVAGYPLVPLPRNDLGAAAAEDSLVLALMRQESQFHDKAISHAGARGLMQLMPRTARRTAHKMGMRYVRRKLTRDPSYNIRLGRAHLTELLDEFQGHYVLALAGYNAGAFRVRRWLVTNGDPRSRAVDTLDWIERIPFRETRNYVQRVLENLQVYRWRLGTARLIPRRPEQIYFALATKTGRKFRLAGGEPRIRSRPTAKPTTVKRRPDPLLGVVLKVKPEPPCRTEIPRSHIAAC